EPRPLGPLRRGRTVELGFDAEQREQRSRPAADVRLAAFVAHISKALFEGERRQHGAGKAARGGQPKRRTKAHGTIPRVSRGKGARPFGVSFCLISDGVTRTRRTYPRF